MSVIIDFVIEEVSMGWQPKGKSRSGELIKNFFTVSQLELVRVMVFSSDDSRGLLKSNGV